MLARDFAYFFAMKPDRWPDSAIFARIVARVYPEGESHRDGTISCLFHGWRFDRSGTCTKIPSQENLDTDISSGAKVDALPGSGEIRIDLGVSRR